MTKIKLLAETEKTVTLRRRDYQALLNAAEDRADLTAVAAHRSHERSVGWTVARRGYLTRAEANRALAGEHPVRIWRQKRGMTQRALAKAARVSASYLTEIETGKKPGSAGALQRLASILETAMESLTRGGAIGDDDATPAIAPQSRCAGG